MTADLDLSPEAVERRLFGQDPAPRLVRLDRDTLAEIRAIRLAQRERGWKLIALDIEAFERAEGEAQREAEAQR